MTRDEVFEKITVGQKWYGGKFSAQSASRILRKHKEGKYRNYEWLFGKFGYIIKSPEQWIENRFCNITSGINGSHNDIQI